MIVECGRRYWADGKWRRCILALRHDGICADKLDRVCPDGGRCWHDCDAEAPCWRTLNAAPMGADHWGDL